MNKVFKEGLQFVNLSAKAKTLDAGEYESCTFKSCDFSNGDLSDTVFLECEFTDCNLSLARLTGTTFRDVRFINCKLLGLHFEDCSKLVLTFEFNGCMLNLSSFNKLKLKKTIFRNSSICEADFTECDLSYSLFDNCSLEKTIFHNTNLEGADLTTASNYSIDPERNRIRKAKFSLASVAGLLDKYDIKIE